MADRRHTFFTRGTDDEWTTFVPTNVATFDGVEVSRTLARPLLEVWFDDDAGIAVHVYASGRFVGEVSLPSSALTDSGETGEADRAWIDAWIERLGIAKLLESGPAAVPASRKESWTERERRTLELHCEYWTTVFSMNNWSLYERYKKHLPPEERPDVDRLCSAVAMGDDAEIEPLIEDILARIWSCDDWDVVIRDPALVDGDDDVWQTWRETLR